MASIWQVFKWSGCPVLKWHSNTGPFDIQPLFDHLNTKLVGILITPLVTELVAYPNNNDKGFYN